MKSEWKRVVAALALMLALSLATAGIAAAQQPPTPPPAAPPQQAGGQQAGGQQQAGPPRPAPGEDKPFDEVVKDMEKIEGLFTFYHKADENKLLMEIQPEQMDRWFLFAGSVDRGTGERGLYSSQMGGDFPFYFRRVGKSIQVVQKNTSFIAQEGTPSARANARSFPDSLMGSAKLQSKPHTERNSVLVDVAELLLTDLPGFAPRLSQVYQPTNYRFDKANSAVGPLKAFPENVLLELWLHYATDNPRSPSLTLPDQRSVPLVVKVELSSLKETPGFRPRLADDRVGYFHTVQQDFTSDRPSTPFVRYINRWHLEKSDANAAVSPAKEPIVFWLENTIPVEYREWFKEGVLLWNPAFERIGIQDALVVKQMPDDADWDPADTRYNTIRWFNTVDASFAIGPSRANPFTGQIYDADIGFSEGIIRGARRMGEELVGPASFEGQEQELPLLPSPWSRDPYRQCTYSRGLVQQAQMGLDALEVMGMLSPEMEDRLMREYIVEVTAHEVGHTLGLRHNFRASTMLGVDELFDMARTNAVSQSSSVMDYNPVVIAPKGRQQGHFLPMSVGPYDQWVIEYGYKPIAGDERAELSRIASRVADPMIPYSTDEDAMGTFSPTSIDPRANQYDQSSDPIAYFRQRMGIVETVWGSMETKLVKPGDGYQVLRRAMGRTMNEVNRALLTSSKYVGGIYHHRDHAGDPDARPAYTPVPAARQREALEFLRTYAFGEKAFQLPPGLLNKLAIERQPGLNWVAYFTTQRLDYPWHLQVLSLQTGVLNRMFHPVTLHRIQDSELLFAPGQPAFTMVDLFRGVDTAIWSELDGAAPRVSSLRRNLQREHLRQMIRLVIRPAPPSAGPSPTGFVVPTPPMPRPPEDATTLARASLTSLQGKIRRTLAAGSVTDPTTRAHLQETQQRIAAALQAQMQKPLE